MSQRTMLVCKSEVRLQNLISQLLNELAAVNLVSVNQREEFTEYLVVRRAAKAEILICEGSNNEHWIFVGASEPYFFWNGSCKLAWDISRALNRMIKYWERPNGSGSAGIKPVLDRE